MSDTLLRMPHLTTGSPIPYIKFDYQETEQINFRYRDPLFPTLTLNGEPKYESLDQHLRHKSKGSRNQDDPKSRIKTPLPFE